MQMAIENYMSRSVFRCQMIYTKAHLEISGCPRFSPRAISLAVPGLPFLVGGDGWGQHPPCSRPRRHVPSSGGCGGGGHGHLGIPHPSPGRAHRSLQRQRVPVLNSNGGRRHGDPISPWTQRSRPRRFMVHLRCKQSTHLESSGIYLQAFWPIKNQCHLLHMTMLSGRAFFKKNVHTYFLCLVV